MRPSSSVPVVAVVSIVLAAFSLVGCSQATSPNHPLAGVSAPTPNASFASATGGASAEPAQDPDDDSSVGGIRNRRSIRIHFTSISGAPTGEALLQGGGSFDPVSGVVKASGQFHVVRDINQGPLSGLKAGEELRWVAVQALRSTGFKCAGGAELLKTAVTDDNTLVLSAHFFRETDELNPLTASLFISADDEALDLTGIQNTWVQGLGCGDADVRLK